MAGELVKRRYITIKGNGLPACTCEPREVPDMLAEFLHTGLHTDQLSEPITLTDAWLTDDELEAMDEWSP